MPIESDVSKLIKFVNGDLIIARFFIDKIIASVRTSKVIDRSRRECHCQNSELVLGDCDIPLNVIPVKGKVDRR